MIVLARLLGITLGCSLMVQTAHGGDPLNSVMWEFVRDNVLQVDSVVFDERVKVYAPESVEDGMNVPVSVRVEGIEDIAEIVVLADHNPIQRALNFFPGRAEPFIAFRMKVQEATPIRAAVRAGDNTWYVGGVWLDAPGGGCTTASATQASRQWETDLNQLAARVWINADGDNRLRLRIIHPMDTGLVSSIPAFHLEELFLKSLQGEELARLEVFEPVSENPVFTFSIPGAATEGSGYLLTGSDNDGNELTAQVNIDGDKLDLSPRVAAYD